jgi:glycosyltransferase involved in cell wall biosynthesis
MKILQVIDTFNTGGAETLLVDLCLRWKRDGISPEVFVLHNGRGTHQTRLQDAGINVTESSRPRLRSSGHVADLAAAISRKRFDLVHVHLHPAQLWAAMALRVTRGAPPGITTEHSTWNRRRAHCWCRPIDRWMYSQFRLAICIGSAARNNLEAWLGPAVCPTCVVANGIDLTRFQRSHTPAHLPDAINGAPAILCVGSLTASKDQETLVRAIAEVEGVHLLLAGDGPLRQAVKLAARKAGVDSRVHFLGIRHDIPDLIAAADLYVQPSRIDGFCIATLEAMAGGRPVIASDIPGLSDVVGNSGILFPAGDHRRLAECIRSLLPDSTLRKELSARGVNRAQQYDIEKTAAQYGRIFHAVVNNTNLADEQIPAA